MKKINLLIFVFFSFLVLPTLTHAYSWDYGLGDTEVFKQQKEKARTDCAEACEVDCEQEENQKNQTGSYKCPIDIDNNASYPSSFTIGRSAIEIKNKVKIIETLTFKGEGNFAISGRCISTDTNVFTVTQTEKTQYTVKYKIEAEGVGEAELVCDFITKSGLGQPKETSKRINVKINPQNSTSGSDMSACEECDEKCVIEGNFEISARDKSGDSGLTNCVKVVVNNLYKKENDKFNFIDSNQWLCANTNNINKVFVYTCDDEYNVDNSIIFDGPFASDPSYISCETLLEGNPGLFVRLFINVIRIGTPILLIALSAADFMKAIGMQDDDAMIKMWKRFATRAIITVLIMLLPTFINLIGKLFNLYDSCGIW